MATGGVLGMSGMCYGVASRCLRAVRYFWGIFLGFLVLFWDCEMCLVGVWVCRPGGVWVCGGCLGLSGCIRGQG